MIPVDLDTFTRRYRLYHQPDWKYEEQAKPVRSIRINKAVKNPISTFTVSNALPGRRLTEEKPIEIKTKEEIRSEFTTSRKTKQNFPSRKRPIQPSGLVS